MYSLQEDVLFFPHQASDLRILLEAGTQRSCYLRTVQQAQSDLSENHEFVQTVLPRSFSTQGLEQVY